MEDEDSSRGVKRKKDSTLNGGDGLSGWGDWAGEGARKPSNRTMKRRKTKKEARDAISKATFDRRMSKRKDAKLPNVIISERRDKGLAQYKVKDVPYPFTSREQYEKVRKAPGWPGPALYRADGRSRCFFSLAATFPFPFVFPFPYAFAFAFKPRHSLLTDHCSCFGLFFLSTLPVIQTLRQPIGNDWNTSKSFKELSQRDVLTRAGTIIEPAQLNKPSKAAGTKLQERRGKQKLRRAERKKQLNRGSFKPY